MVRGPVHALRLIHYLPQCTLRTYTPTFLHLGDKLVILKMPSFKVFGKEFDIPGFPGIPPRLVSCHFGFPP